LKKVDFLVMKFKFKVFWWRFFLVVQLSVIAVATSAATTASSLYIPWPAGWKVGATQGQKGVTFLAARFAGEGEQDLKVTAISVKEAKTPVTEASIHDLAEKLRDAAAKTAVDENISLKKFSASKGYYFSATDKNPRPGDFTQLVEGVILNQGYLINFTLLTNDAAGKDATQMVDALDKLSIK